MRNSGNAGVIPLHTGRCVTPGVREHDANGRRFPSLPEYGVSRPSPSCRVGGVVAPSVRGVRRTTAPRRLQPGRRAAEVRERIGGRDGPFRRLLAALGGTGRGVRRYRSGPRAERIHRIPRDRKRRSARGNLPDSRARDPSLIRRTHPERRLFPVLPSRRPHRPNARRHVRNDRRNRDARVHGGLPPGQAPRVPDRVLRVLR